MIGQAILPATDRIIGISQPWDCIHYVSWLYSDEKFHSLNVFKPLELYDVFQGSFPEWQCGFFCGIVA